jgi:hypothetical protein
MSVAGKQALIALTLSLQLHKGPFKDRVFLLTLKRIPCDKLFVGHQKRK